MNEFFDFGDVALTTFVCLIGINDIESAISIAMLTIQLLYILVRFFIGAYHKWKNKDTKGVKEDVSKFVDDLGDLTDDGLLNNSNKEDK